MSNSDQIDIPLDIKTNCNKYDSSNPDKKKNIMLEFGNEYITKTILYWYW